MDFLVNLLSAVTTSTSAPPTTRNRNISLKFILDTDSNVEQHLRSFKNPKSTIPFQESCPIFRDEFAPLSGKLHIQNVLENLPHRGIELEFTGVISPIFCDKVSNKLEEAAFTTFTTHKINIQPSDTITNNDLVIPFNFTKLHFTYPSYDGDFIQIRYYIKATICGTTIHKEKTLWFSPSIPKPTDSLTEPTIRNFSCGLNNFFIAEISLDKSIYTTTDTIEGRLYFSFLQMPLHSIGVSLLRCEEYKGELLSQTVLLSKEICLGTPGLADTFKWILDLSLLDSPQFVPSTPFKDGIHNIFVMNYYLSIIVTDLSDRRYYKKEQIELCSV